MRPATAALDARSSRPRLLLVGEHDKGLGEPFAPSTMSGKRLRAMLGQLPVDYTFANMMSASSASPSRRDARRLERAAAGCEVVVLLGRRVQAAVSAILPQGVALPHPASRRPVDLANLHQGLNALVDGARRRTDTGRTAPGADRSQRQPRARRAVH